MDNNTNTSKRASRGLAGSVYLITFDGKTLSLPIPSKSYRDPLNWSLRKRAGALFSLCFFATIAYAIVQGPSLMLTPLANEFTGQDLRPFGLETLLWAPTLFIGIGAFLWIPLSLAIGRRSVLLIANVILLSSTLWAGVATRFHSLLIAVSFHGLAEGVSTSAGLLMIIDLTFIHQRPLAIALVWSVVGTVTLSILAGVFQVTGTETDWRLFYKLWIPPVIISCFLVFFFFPETYFLRPAIAFDGRILLQSVTENIQLYKDWDSAAVEKGLPDVPHTTWRLKLNELQLWDTADCSWRAMRHCYLQILLCFINPHILWVMLLNSLVFGGVISIGMTYTGVLADEPYNIPIRRAALVNLSGAAGAFLAWPASGLLTSKIIYRLAMRNGGVRDAEFYLPAFILPVLASATSLIMYGVAVQHQLHSSLIFVAYGLNAFSFVSLATVNTIWVTEAFPRHAAAAGAVVTGGIYISTLFLSFAIQPWATSQGIANANIELALMVVVVGCIGIPIAFWGEKLGRVLMEGGRLTKVVP
ncbi:hypothetical protein EAF04_005706 [Stromatinia cepivora]|nr:hypothetical protein EAF04_005706 [Stromatinia cepivora]